MQFSACIDMIYRDLPIGERVSRVAEAGIQAVEFWRWRNKDIQELERALESSKTQVAGFCVDPMGRIVDPATHDEFVSGVKESLDVAKRLSTEALIVTVGQELNGVPRERQKEAIVTALRRAAPLAEDAGVVLCVEPLNTLVDHRGYFLATSDETSEILGRVASPAVKMLYDVYHQQITEGNLIARMREHVDRIGHVHIADVPGRHEPGTGEINYANVLEALDHAGYRGFVGFEFKPVGDPGEAMRNIRALAPI